MPERAHLQKQVTTSLHPTPCCADHQAFVRHSGASLAAPRSPLFSHQGGRRKRHMRALVRSQRVDLSLRSPTTLTMLRTHQHWLPVVLWMGFIFVMSTDLGAFEHTSRIIEPLLRWLYPGISPEAVGLVHLLIRKGGHFSEYAVLALLVRRAAGLSLPPGSTGLKVAGLALLVAAAYAATDELHQSFVPGRTASLVDVLIDTSGAFAALAVASLWKGRRGRTI